MRSTFLARLVGLSEAFHRWRVDLARLEASRRAEIAAYADAVAATLARAAGAIGRLEAEPGDVRARRDALRELARIGGYVEDIVATLEAHVDGRKLAGVKRRLDRLAEALPLEPLVEPVANRIDCLVEAEGYFRALADALRA